LLVVFYYLLFIIILIFTLYNPKNKKTKNSNWYRWLDRQFPQKEEKDKVTGKPKSPQPDLMRSVKMMLVDELIYDPFCIVFFYTYIGLLNGQGMNEIKETIAREYWPTQTASWKVFYFRLFACFDNLPFHGYFIFFNNSYGHLFKF
jgi:hypothetical protein